MRKHTVLSQGQLERFGEDRWDGYQTCWSPLLGLVAQTTLETNASQTQRVSCLFFWRVDLITSVTPVYIHYVPFVDTDSQDTSCVDGSKPPRSYISGSMASLLAKWGVPSLHYTCSSVSRCFSKKTTVAKNVFGTQACFCSRIWFCTCSSCNVWMVQDPFNVLLWCELISWPLAWATWCA